MDDGDCSRNDGGGMAGGSNGDGGGMDKASNPIGGYGDSGGMLNELCKTK